MIKNEQFLILCLCRSTDFYEMMRGRIKQLDSKLKINVKKLSINDLENLYKKLTNMNEYNFDHMKQSYLDIHELG